MTEDEYLAPLTSDFDGDSLTLAQEISSTYNTNPSLADTDGDGTNDNLDSDSNSSTGNSLSGYSGTPIIARLNVRGHIGTGDDERFMAFKLTGSADVMVRAVGDALSAYSLTNLLVDPEMRL